MILSSLFGRQRPAAVPPGARVYAVGDIHGRMDLFEDMLALIHADNAARGAAETELVLLGDLIDRGPDSAAVVARAMEPIAGFTSQRTLMGNHEDAMLKALAGDRSMMTSWLRYGGRQTLLSWGADAEQLQEGDLGALIELAVQLIPRRQRTWLSKLPLTYRVGGYLFVHAGVRPGVSIERQKEEDCLWIREDFLDSRINHGAMIVHGHSISEAVEEKSNRIGIDTGAYATGRLTALGLEGRSRWFLSTEGDAALPTKQASLH